MNTLDLSPFHGIDTAHLTPDKLEALRSAYAAILANYAFTCRSNKEFLDGLIAASPPDSRLIWPRLIGTGSCRRTYIVSLGLVLKVQRGLHDPLDDADLASRGGTAYLPQLRARRQTSNYCEIMTSCAWPNATPTIYAAALSFDGKRPSILISEAARPLNYFYPNSTKGIDPDKIFIGADDGRLIVCDPRFSRETSKPNDLAFANEGMWIGNVGLDASQKFVLLDTGNFHFDVERINSTRNEIAKLTMSLVAQDRILTHQLMRFYGEARRKEWNAPWLNKKETAVPNWDTSAAT